jgi:hypothetical protein
VTPAEEARFIQLWQQGASYRDLAQALGCALGTVGSRAYTLVRQGKIQARPKGGNYTRSKAQGRQDGPPATPTAPAPPAPPVAPAPPAMTFVAVPEIQEILSIVKELQTRVASLERTRVPPRYPRHPLPLRPPRHPHPPRRSARTCSNGRCGSLRP